MITRTGRFSATQARILVALVASVASVPFVPWLGGCSSDTRDQSDASDVDADTDTDTDTDTDNDTDTDTDTDSDTDTDTDTATDIDTDESENLFSDLSMDWFIRTETGNHAYLNGLACFPDGSAFLSGSYSTSITLDPEGPAETTYTDELPDHQNAFKGRYDSDGALMWSTGDDAGIMSSGGGRAEPLTGGSVAVGLVHGTAVDASFTTFYISRYGEAGSFEGDTHAETPLETDSAMLRFLSPMGDDSLAVLGEVSGAPIIDEGLPTETTLLPGLNLLHLNPDLTVDWATVVVNEEIAEIAGVEALDDGTIFVSGKELGTLVFGEGEPSEETLYSDSDYFVFVARYNADGQLAWVTQSIVTDTDSTISAGDLVAFSDGTSVLIGKYSSGVEFGTDTTAPILADTTSGHSAIYMMKLDADGELLWVSFASGDGGAREVTATNIGDDAFLVAGTITGGKVTFGDGEPSEAILDSMETDEGYDKSLFVAMYDSSGSFHWVTRRGVGNIDTLHLGSSNDQSFTIAGTCYCNTEPCECIFNPGEIDEQIFSGMSAESDDMFAAKYTLL